MAKKVKIRQASQKDLSEIIRIEKEAWLEGTEATEKLFRSRIEIYPVGVQVATFQGKIIGVVVFELINYDINNPITSQKEAIDNGMIKKSHYPNGDTIFGIDLTAVPDTPRGTGSR